MRHLRAGFRRDQRGKPGIAEEVEERRALAHRRAGRLQPLAHKGPVRLLLRERADMAERGEAALKAYFSVPAGPRFGDAGPPLPAPGPFLVDVAGEDCVRPLPRRRVEAGRPDRLLLRAVERQRPKTLQLAAV